MIATITLNPSIDRRYSLKDYYKDGIFRCDDYSAVAGGKGLNVSKVIKQLGESPMCLGFIGGFSGAYIKEQLEALDIHTEFTEISSETRTCLGIIDEAGRHMEILERGPEIKEHEIKRFVEKFHTVLHETKIVIASGSIPKGVHWDIYKELIQLANQNNIRFILDSSSTPLIEGIKSSPYLIKPNISELKAITKVEIKNDDDVIKACKGLINKGARNIAVSLGAEGMMYVGEKESFKVKIPKVKVLNTVGSGDSTVAGFAVGLSRGLPIEDILKLSNACGISNAMEKETGKIDINNICHLVSKIEVLKLS